MFILNIAPDMHISGEIYLGWDKLPIVENIWYANTILSFILAGELLLPLVKLAYQHFDYEIINKNIFDVWST